MKEETFESIYKDIYDGYEIEQLNNIERNKFKKLKQLHDKEINDISIYRSKDFCDKEKEYLKQISELQTENDKLKEERDLLNIFYEENK